MDEKQFMKIMEYMYSLKKEDGTFEIPFDLSFRDETIGNPEENALKLKECFEFFKIENIFEEGQLVIWKKGLKNRKCPAYNEPAIVIKVLDEPIFSGETDSGSPYFREPLDIILGVIINDNFEMFYYDKRRLIHLINDDITKRSSG